MNNPAQLSAYVYELCEIDALPVLDCSRSIKVVVLPRRWLRRLNRFLHHFKTVFGAMYLVGLSIGAAIPFASARFGRWAAVLVLVFQIPAVLSALISLRYDMVRLIVRTYEFWFFSIVNVTTSVLLGLYLNDQRWLSLVVACLGYENVIMIDANFRAIQYSLMAAFGASILHIATVVYVLFHLVDEARIFSLFTTPVRTIQVDDVLANGLLILAVLLFRNAYRKHWSIKQLGKHSTLVQCISYRCLVSMVPRKPAIGNLHQARVPHKIFTATKMRYVPLMPAFNASQTFLSSVKWSPTPLSRWAAHCLYFCGLLGLVCTIAAFVPHPSAVRIVASASFGFTFVFWMVFVSLYQRQVLRHILLSFDFVFLCFHLTLAHACVCDMLYWDIRCLAVASSWLWIVWASTLDALTPVLRKKLYFRTDYAIPVLVLFLLGQISICIELVFFNYWKLQDRPVFTAKLYGHSMQVRVIPFFFSRLFPVFCWSCRLLWRIFKRRHGELILLQGYVAYEDYQLNYRQSKPTRKRSMVVVKVRHRSRTIRPGG